MKRLAIVVVLALLAVVAAVPAGAAGPKVYVSKSCLKNGIKPKVVIIFCGDAGLLFAELKWSSFGGSHAKATGKQEMKTCDPDCASGGVDSKPVVLTFSKLRSCKRAGGSHFAGRYYRSVKAVTTDGQKTYGVPCPVH